MFYFYYPAELESSLGPATVSIKRSDEKIANVELLQELTIEHCEANSYIFYPTLSSLLSYCLFNLSLRSKVISYYETLSNEISDLKKRNKATLICLGISLVTEEEFKPAINRVSYKVSFSSKSNCLERMLSEYFISKNKSLKKRVGTLSAISQFVEEIQISENDIQSELEFINDSLLINSNYGGSSDIESSIALLHEKSKCLEQLTHNYKELENQYSVVDQELKEQVTYQVDLQKDHKRAIHQIQVLQESLVEKYQEFALKESQIESKYSKKIAALNEENDQLLNTLKKLESEKASIQQAFDNSKIANQKLQKLYDTKVLELESSITLNSELECEKTYAQKALDSSISEIQKLQELYEAKSIEVAKLTTLNREIESEKASIQKALDSSIDETQKLQKYCNDKSSEIAKLTTLNGELEKENNVLATKILDVNEEQMNLSLLYGSLTEQTEKDKKQAIAKQKVLERELTRLKTRNAELTHKYSSLRYNVFCTNRELELIQSSPFWKGSRLLKNLKSKLSKSKISESVKADIALIATSEYFDFDWYLETYNDVQEANVDPAQHYLIAGAEEGRLPGPNFDGNWYLERYPDVAEAEVNPLLHYIKCGKREGRVPSPKMLADKRKS